MTVFTVGEEFVESLPEAICCHMQITYSGQISGIQLRDASQYEYEL